MECAICHQSDPPVDPVICFKCQKQFHASCTRLVDIATWTKMNYDKRATWKCDGCKVAAEPLPPSEPPLWYAKLLDDLKQITDELHKTRAENREFQTKIETMRTALEEANAVKTEFESLKLKLADLETRSRSFESRGATSQFSSFGLPGAENQFTSFNLPLFHDPRTDDKIPKYLESEIQNIPKLNSENPWSLIKFLERLYLINEMNGCFFAPIFRRVATYQHHSILQRLATEPNFTFATITKSLLEELTTPQTRLNIVQGKILRGQYSTENFRTYVSEVTKFNSILSQYSEGELVKSILQGTNSNTRAKFHFSTRPKDIAELHVLVNEVEKLELNENLQKSKSHAKPQHSNSANNTPRNDFQQKTERPQTPDDKHGYKNEKSANFSKQEPSKNFRKGSPEHPKKTNGNGQTKKSTFHQRNPNFNKQFRQNFLQPMIPQPHFSGLQAPPFPYPVPWTMYSPFPQNNWGNSSGYESNGGRGGQRPSGLLPIRAQKNSESSSVSSKSESSSGSSKSEKTPVKKGNQKNNYKPSGSKN